MTLFHQGRPRHPRGEAGRREGFSGRLWQRGGWWATACRSRAVLFQNRDRKGAASCWRLRRSLTVAVLKDGRALRPGSRQDLQLDVADLDDVVDAQRPLAAGVDARAVDVGAV